MGGQEFMVANVNDGYLGLNGKSFFLTAARILVCDVGCSSQTLIFLF